MQNYNINDLPKLVKSKTITAKQAANFLWVKIYQEPALFGLNSFTEDQKSEFLLEYHEKLEQIFFTYDETKKKFFFYLKKYIELVKITWLRKINYKYTIDQLNDDYLKSNNDATYEQSFEDSILNNKCSNNKSQICVKHTSLTTNPKLKLAQITALILCLKSCHAITDDILENISKFTKTPTDQLVKMIEKMKAITYKKTQFKELLIKRRDSAFYFHRKYTLSLKNSIPGTKSYFHFLSRYLVRTKSWHLQNYMLNTRFRDSPSNQSIGEELNISPRKISYYLSKAMKNDSTFKKEVSKFIKENDELN